MTPNKKYDIVIGLLRQTVPILEKHYGDGPVLRSIKYFLQFGELPPEN